MLDKAADAIEKLVGKTDTFKWIPVTERLPVIEDTFICKIKCPKGEFIEADFWDGKDWYNTDWPNEKATEYVTHWMPLPQPQEER